jgi:Sulfotransferase family
MATGSGGSVPRALLVLGCPRSGTTLLGDYLASRPDALNMNEYGGFQVAHHLALDPEGNIGGPFADAYRQNVASHASQFAQGLAERNGCGWFCDATPWNIFAVEGIAESLPDAIFVLVLRHYSGVVQSLRHAFDRGGIGAGRTFTESAALWAMCNARVGKLPIDRTVVISYDALASEPETTLSSLHAGLGRLGYDCSSLDPRHLAISHASPEGPRPRLGTMEEGRVVLNPIPSYDREHWSGDIHKTVWPVVRDVHRHLQQRFPAVYRLPPSPRVLRVHDDIDGLVEIELGNEW